MTLQVNGNAIDALASAFLPSYSVPLVPFLTDGLPLFTAPVIVHRADAQTIGKAWVLKLKGILPRQQFDVSVVFSPIAETAEIEDRYLVFRCTCKHLLPVARLPRRSKSTSRAVLLWCDADSKCAPSGSRPCGKMSRRDSVRTRHSLIIVSYVRLMIISFDDRWWSL
jgi:hypothetical protein